MSYDLMVFDVAAAPKTRKAFMAWYHEQAKWAEPHTYEDPEVSTPELRAWFIEMIVTFPPMNGPLASDDVDDPKVTDYGLGRSVIYAGFAWSQTQPAYELMKNLAAKHRVGFFDVSSDEGQVWLPAENGGLSNMQE